VHQSALLGQGLLWRSLGRSLLANFIACTALLRLLAAAAQPKAAASKSTSLIMNVCPLLPLQLPKNYTDAASKASLAQRLGSTEQDFHPLPKTLPRQKPIF